MGNVNSKDRRVGVPTVLAALLWWGVAEAGYTESGAAQDVPVATMGLAAEDGSQIATSADSSIPIGLEGAKALDTVVVEGTMPGPGMWQVKKGDHTMWLLGRISPLPKKLEWRGEDVQQVLDEAGVFLVAPSVTVSANVGFWGGLMLAPKALGARKDPEKQPLNEQIPEDTYARWAKLKAKYLGGRRSVEKWRPIFAADRLVKAAERKSKLTRDRWVDEQVEKWAKKRKVPIIGPTAKVVIEDPKQMLGEFRETRLDDLPCFESVLDWLERDLERMRQRANAWAVGDIELLREMAGENPRVACVDSVLESDMFKKRGFEDLPQRQRDAWLTAVDSALDAHSVSLAILPLEEMIGEASYLAALTERGYEVIAPE